MLAAHSAPSAQQQDNNRDHSSGSGPQQQPLVTEPDQVIRGGPSIRSYTIQVGYKSRAASDPSVLTITEKAPTRSQLSSEGTAGFKNLC